MSIPAIPYEKGWNTLPSQTLEAIAEVMRLQKIARLYDSLEVSECNGDFSTTIRVLARRTFLSKVKILPF